MIEFKKNQFSKFYNLENKNFLNCSLKNQEISRILQFGKFSLKNKIIFKTLQFKKYSNFQNFIIRKIKKFSKVYNMGN